MPRYAFLLLPAANRVYAAAAVDLAQAELEVFGATVLGHPVTSVTARTIGGVGYVTFDGPALGDRDVAYLSNLSSIYALFEVGDDELLRPETLRPLDRYDDDLLTIQRYVGKTNEQFTKLLLNVTLVHSRRAGDLLTTRARVLDPLCGRGTTLNQALMYGFDAAGIEYDARAVDAYEVFLKGWLRDKRIKHTNEKGKIRRGGRLVGRRFGITIDGSQKLTVVEDDTASAADHFANGSFDVVVADLPYGVQHTSRTAAERPSRDASGLVASGLPAWTELLARGGAIGLSWNTNVMTRDALAALLADAGLEVVETPAMKRFAHRVDQSIRRDLIVAIKT